MKLVSEGVVVIQLILEGSDLTNVELDVLQLIFDCANESNNIIRSLAKRYVNFQEILYCPVCM